MKRFSVEIVSFFRRKTFSPVLRLRIDMPSSADRVLRYELCESRSNYHPTANATTTVSQSKSRMVKRKRIASYLLPSSSANRWRSPSIRECHSSSLNAFW